MEHLPNCPEVRSALSSEELCLCEVEVNDKAPKATNPDALIVAFYSVILTVCLASFLGFVFTMIWIFSGWQPGHYSVMVLDLICAVIGTVLARKLVRRS